MNNDNNNNKNDNVHYDHNKPEDINPFHKVLPTTSDQPREPAQTPTPTPTPPNMEQQPPPQAAVDSEKWGTQVMGHPAVPTCHPGNKKAAQWGAPSEEAQRLHYPYLQYAPIEDHSRSFGNGSSSSNNPAQTIVQHFNTWGNKAESLANNIWHNLKTGSSVHGAAWAKVNVTAKAITEGGFESLYKSTFATYPNEKLKKSFACYLSTSTGPVAGTLYLSNIHIAFCSDRPLSFTAPSGQQTWSYYKIMVPLSNVATVNPVVMRESPKESYIQILTVDGQDFWFMGFVNYSKASRHLSETIASFVASG